MKVTLLKNWAGFKAKDEFETNDRDVLLKGNDLGVWKLSKEQLKKLESKESAEIEETEE